MPTTTEPVAPPCGVVASPDVVITNSTQSCSVSTHVGVTIHIVLDPGFTWGTPSSDSTAVEVVNVKRQSSGRLDADVRTLRIGLATVSATGSILCPPGQPCPALARLWALHITVGASTPRSAALRASSLRSLFAKGVFQPLGVSNGHGGG